MDIMDISNIDCKPTVIYSRFFLHSIDEVAEGKMFDWVSKLPSSTLFCLECRSEKDMELPKYYGKTHYRRGANLKKIVNKLEKNNYKIHFSIESNGLAVYKEEDPFVIRVISEKL
jgi:hypothetical protein